MKKDTHTVNKLTRDVWCLSIKIQETDAPPKGVGDFPKGWFYRYDYASCYAQYSPRVIRVSSKNDMQTHENMKILNTRMIALQCATINIWDLVPGKN